MSEVANYPLLRDSIAQIPVTTLVKRVGSTPFYAYDAETIRERLRQLKRCGTVRYAQKACSTIAILQLVRSQGVKIDAVSAAEIQRALCAGYEPEDIAYTADIFDADALKLVTGSASGCIINVGSPDMIRQLGECLGAQARGRELTIRVNPGFGHGHSQKTNTGGDLSKHGVWHSEVGACLSLAQQYGMTITGLHMHIGSGTDFDHLKTVCDAMTKVALEVGPQIKSISCGGGLPVPYHTNEEYIDLDAFGAIWRKTIQSLESAFGHALEFELEPGRYVVAESGYLLTQIRAIKKQNTNIFYLVDAGFTHLVRPMAYGSYHPISIAYNPENKRNDEYQEQDVVVGGPLCESGDVFTQGEGGVVEKRRLPVAQVGDYLILECAGAYGASMGSNYNSKYYAPELLLDNGDVKLIRRKQSFEHLIANEIF
ncbi:MAG: diaminopimelate decarboxylase [Planctomycetia bacterium]|nr:diaminopimelate decarboxylase [Planctomycetia bacterium]